jgi:hypothetical protein
MGRIELAKTGTNSLAVPGLLTRKNRLDRSKDHVELAIWKQDRSMVWPLGASRLIEYS